MMTTGTCATDFHIKRDTTQPCGDRLNDALKQAPYLVRSWARSDGPGGPQGQPLSGSAYSVHQPMTSDGLDESNKYPSAQKQPRIAEQALVNQCLRQGTIHARS